MEQQKKMRLAIKKGAAAVNLARIYVEDGAYDSAARHLEKAAKWFDAAAEAKQKGLLESVELDRR